VAPTTPSNPDPLPWFTIYSLFTMHSILSEARLHKKTLPILIAWVAEQIPVLSIADRGLFTGRPGTERGQAA